MVTDGSENRFDPLHAILQSQEGLVRSFPSISDVTTRLFPIMPSEHDVSKTIWLETQADPNVEWVLQDYQGYLLLEHGQ